VSTLYRSTFSNHRRLGRPGDPTSAGAHGETVTGIGISLNLAFNQGSRVRYAVIVSG
jgi:hypothetical protein